VTQLCPVRKPPASLDEMSLYIPDHLGLKSDVMMSTLKVVTIWDEEVGVTGLCQVRWEGNQILELNEDEVISSP